MDKAVWGWGVDRVCGWGLVDGGVWTGGVHTQHTPATPSDKATKVGSTHLTGIHSCFL